MPDQEMLRGIQDPSSVQNNITPVRDLYQMFNVGQPFQQNAGGVPASGLMNVLQQQDALKRDIDPIQTSLNVIKPLRTSDGIDKYGYSNFLNNGDNEDRYAQGFRIENPNKFYSGLNPFKLLYRGGYWGGAFLEKTLESAVVKTGQGLSNLYGLATGAITNGVIGNIQDAVSGHNDHTFNDWITGATDNVFSKFFDGWDNYLKSRYSYYQEAADRNKRGFIASMSDGDFWMNDISDGLGFLVSAGLEAGVISKLGFGTRLASQIAPLAEGTSAAAIGGAETSTFGGRLLRTLGGAKGFAKGVDMASETLALTAIESASEANEAKDKIASTLKDRLNPETGLTYTQDEIKKLSGEGAAQVFKQNMAILAAPKFLETMVFNRVGKYLKGKLNAGAAEAELAEGAASDHITSESILKGTSYQRASTLSNLWKVGSAAPIGMLSEGLWEENVQLAISRTAENSYGLGQYWNDRPSSKQENIDSKSLSAFSPYGGDVGKKYMEQTNLFFRGSADDRHIDDELSKSIGIGGLFGIGGGIVHGTLGLRQQVKVDRYWNSRINAATANMFQSNDFFMKETKEEADPENPGKTKPVEKIVMDEKTGQPLLDEKKVKAYLAKMDNIQGILNIIQKTEDPKDENNKAPQAKELNKLARNVMFSNLAMEYIAAGKKDLLIKNLGAVANFSDTDIKALGYEPGTLKDGEKKELSAKMIKMVERLDKVHNWVEDNVIDNVSEARKGFKGLVYTKTQTQQREENFQAKKAYLKGLGMQTALLDSYIDDINASEEKRVSDTQQTLNPLSSIKDKDGNDVVDYHTPSSSLYRSTSTRLAAINNMIDVLHHEFADHWENLKTDIGRMNASPKGQQFNERSKTANGGNVAYRQVKAQEALEKINELQEEKAKLHNERNNFLANNENFHLVDEDGTPVDPKDVQQGQNLFVAPKNVVKDPSTLEDLESEKIRRINDVKRQEIGIQKDWIAKEWQLTAALKEEKSKAGRTETYFSRRMTLSKNAYNTYFEREVKDTNNDLGQRRLKLYHKDEAKRVTAKQYVNNEKKVMTPARIEGKVREIIADVNGRKLLGEINTLLERDLPSDQFAVEIKAIIDKYNGQPIILSEKDKGIVNDQLEATEDERNFVASMMEHMPDDDRFNDKYYDVDAQGNFTIKPQYDSMPVIAQLSAEFSNRIDDLNKIKSFLDAIPTEIQGDWKNEALSKLLITKPYVEVADNIISEYNKMSNNGESEMAGEGLSTKQDLDRVEEEINELGQLKTIFQDRHKTDMILASPEFKGFIESLDKRIEDLKKIKDIIKERMSSRLRENQDFLIDSVNNLVDQLGVAFDSSVSNQAIHDAVQGLTSTDTLDKLKKSLSDLKALSEKDKPSEDEKKQIVDSYWNINGQVAAIQELIKTHNEKAKVLDELAKQKTQAITDIQSSALMQKIKDQPYYKDVIKNIDTSLLGVLQSIFYQTEFSKVGLPMGDTEFLDDQPSSPVYKFREDYNLRKFIRGVDKDNSRTPENTEVSKEDLLEFLNIAKKIQNAEDLQKTLNSSLNMLDQVELEKATVQAKIAEKGKADNKFSNLIVSSIQQVFFMRNIASFLKRETGIDGFKNWTYIQAPGGSGKTQTMGTWFNVISGIPRDRVLATAFTEEAARGIKKALLVGEDGPKDAVETAAHLRTLTKNKNFDQDVLIIDEFPAIDVQTQKELFDAVQEYSKAKKEAGGTEFKVITMGDTNQLTFNQDGSISPRPTIIINPNFFNDKEKSQENNHPSQMNIIPSLTVNFRSNIFAVTSFIDQFRGSNKDNVNANIKTSSTDPHLEGKDSKGVVSVSKSEFKNKLVAYIKANIESNRSRTLIVNESKIDEYKKLLSDNGIKVITDPNDELSKGGIYVTTVKNVQGFSFDEVFIDLDNKDKTLFSGSASPEYIYNKAMYVAASRARNLIVATNFPNAKNVEDDSINSLENKSLAELQTKDDEFVSNRDSEINGAKEALGEKYDTTRSPKVPEPPTATKSTEKVETPIDHEAVKTDTSAEDEDGKQDDQEEDATKVEPEEEKEPEIVEPNSADEEELQETGPQVIDTQEDETVEQDEEVAETKETLPEFIKKIADKVKDTTVTAFDKVKSSIVKLLFPTGQTLKYKMTDSDFTINFRRLLNKDYENKQLQDGDKVILIPFRQEGKTKSNRRFGYAVVSPAIDNQDQEIPNSYRTVAVLSDREIDRFKDNPDTKNIYDAITESEKRSAEFVSISYSDVNSQNGFEANTNKVLINLIEGTVAHANPIRYFYQGEYHEMDGAKMSGIIEDFIKSFYKDLLESMPPEQQLSKLNELRAFYNNPKNARIVIPTNPDLIETPRRKPRLAVPPELRSYVRPGRPYLVLRSIDNRSSQQFIGLSRKFLNGREHQHILEPILNFMKLGESVKATIQSKGINDRFGYSAPLSSLLSRVANEYRKDSSQSEYSFIYTNLDKEGKEQTKTVKFNNIEAERIKNLHEMYSMPATDTVTIDTEDQMKKITDKLLPDGTYQRKRRRTLIFEDGTSVVGTVQSYDSKTKTYVVRDSRTGEEYTKSGVLRTLGSSSAGEVQQALDNIMSSNGHISKKFVSSGNKIGFVTARGQVAGENEKRLKFMALLGSKQSAVPKSFRENGDVKEYYNDVFDILKDLFTFDDKRNLVPREREFVTDEGTIDKAEIKFRVPVPIRVTEGDVDLRHDYSNSDSNSSRDNEISNSRYFETNFDNLVPSEVMVQFSDNPEEGEESKNSPANEKEQELEKEDPEATAIQIQEEAPTKLDDLTEEEIRNLPFAEIRNRMNEEQTKRMEKWAVDNGFGDLDTFFKDASDPYADQDEFKDYVINCIL